MINIKDHNYKTLPRIAELVSNLRYLSSNSNSSSQLQKSKLKRASSETCPYKSFDNGHLGVTLRGYTAKSTYFCNSLNLSIITFDFVLGEIIDNIELHADSQNTYILAQYWTAINTCEICFLDDGIGIFKSLKNAGKDVLNNMDALQKVLRNRLSSKEEFGESKRGTGIANTCVAIVNKEINGEFFILS
jgi:hypothetical protein